MKKILFINSQSLTDSSKATFTHRLEDYFDDHNQDYLVTDADEMIVLIDENEVLLYIKNQKIDTNEILPFVRFSRLYKHFVSFLYQCAEVWDWRLNDTTRLASDVVDKKASQMLMCYKHNIPFPKSMVVTSESLLKSQLLIENFFGYPFVLKGYGARGTSVYKIHSFEQLETIDLDSSIAYLIQEYIENSFDIRVLVYEGKVIGGMKRESDAFLNNYSQGGKITPYSPTELEKEISIKMCSVTNITFGGVDIIHKNGKPVIIEVNLSPQIKGFEIANKDVDVVQIVGAELINQSRKPV